VGCSLSGSGPSIFAVAESEPDAARILDAIRSGFRAEGLESRGWVCRLDLEGARLVNDQIQALGLGEERLP
jgi:homoserine kinase